MIGNVRSVPKVIEMALYNWLHRSKHDEIILRHVGEISDSTIFVLSHVCKYFFNFTYFFTRLCSRRVVMCLVVVYIRSFVRLFVRSFPHTTAGI